VGERYTETFKVRWAECDPQNVVFNGAYFVYFDTVQSGLWTRALGPWQERHDRGVDFVLVETTLQFLQPARYEDVLEVSAAIERLGTTSMGVELEAVRDGAVLVRARSAYVCVDGTAFTKQAIPPWVREGLGPYLI
jgi:acyl-CoA thioester hydrolase